MICTNIFAWGALMCAILCVGRYYVWSSPSWSLFIMFGCFIAPGALLFPLCVISFARDCYFKYFGKAKGSPSPTKKGSEVEAKGSSPEEKIDIELDSFVNREQ